MPCFTTFHGSFAVLDKPNRRVDTVSSSTEVRLFAEAGVLHIELTNLVVPTLDDDTEEFMAMINWIASIFHEISRDIFLRECI